MTIVLKPFARFQSFRRKRQLHDDIVGHAAQLQPFLDHGLRVLSDDLGADGAGHGRADLRERFEEVATRFRNE